MKLVNPLHYPIAVLAGGIVLVAAARFLRVPPVVAIPAAVGTTIAGAVALKSREPETLNLDDPELERELQTVRQASLDLSQKAATVRSQSAALLTDSTQVELLATLQLWCDRAAALPAKVDALTRRLQHSNAILSVDQLQQQLATVQQRRRSSSGIAKAPLDRLAASLERNLQLAKSGQDARLAQVVSLSTLIQDAAGTLQQLQTQLVAADRVAADEAPAQLQQLQVLGDTLVSLEENMELLVRQ